MRLGIDFHLQSRNELDLFYLLGLKRSRYSAAGKKSISSYQAKKKNLVLLHNNEHNDGDVFFNILPTGLSGRADHIVFQKHSFVKISFIVIR